MFKSYFLIAVRNLFKNKLSSIINILGLSVSIMLTIHLTIFLLNELSYDKFNKNRDRIYRVLSEFTMTGESTMMYAINQGQITNVINGAIPDVEACVRIYNHDIRTFEYNEKRFSNNRLFHVDSSFFDVFSYRLLSGNPHKDLAVIGNLFISRSLALKVFGTKDAVGKTIKMTNKDYNITGVFDDLPGNSHLQFDLVTGNADEEMLAYHSGLEFLTYILLKDNVNQAAALNKVCEKYNELTKMFWKNTEGITCIAHTQRLTDIWLHSGNIKYDGIHGNINDIYIAAILIIFVLLIAIVNFINLMVAKAEDRVKEIAIRKTAGAKITDIQRQFMGETLFIILVSVIVALILVQLSQPLFNNFTGKALGFSGSFSLKLIFVLIILGLGVSIVSGIYPAIYLSEFPVTGIFKGGSSGGKKTNSLSKGLVLLQFSIVIFMVSCLLIYYKQMNFIKNKDLGFSKEQVVSVSDQNESLFRSYESIKQILLSNPEILNVTLAQSISSEGMSGQYATRLSGPSGKETLVKQTRTSYDFIKTFKMKLAEGRDFDISMPSDYRTFIINESAKKELGLPENAVGQRLVLNEDTGDLIGVVKDFHFASLHNKIEPLFITLNRMDRGKMYIRLSPGDIPNELNFIKASLQKVDPHYLFEYEFVDDYFNSQYKSDERISQMLFYATLICILIALVGLIALASVTTAKRTREIGIRKVFGASVADITGKLLSDILKWVVFANIIAWPCAYYGMHRWLDNFAYRIHFPYLILLFAGIMAVLIASLSVIFLVLRNAVRNPVTALKYE